MKRILPAVVALLLTALPVSAQYFPPGGAGGPYQGSTVVPGTSGNVMTSDGSAWTSAAAAGGGSSPFMPAGFAAVSAFSSSQDLAVSPAGDYVYVAGTLASNGHGAVAKVKISDGSVSATVDLGATYPESIVVSPDGTAVYVADGGGTTWWKLATASLAITHTSTLAVAMTSLVQGFDLSPDGTKYVYTTNNDAKLYIINTTTYVVTNQTMSHTAGNLSAVCFYNGSNTDVYVSHTGSADVDKYAIGGAYDSTISTTAGGTQLFSAMRSGVNGTFFIADSGTQPSIIAVASGTPTVYRLMNTPRAIAVNRDANLVDLNSDDICAIQCYGLLYTLDYESALTPVPMPAYLASNGVNEGTIGCALMPDDSNNIITLSGNNHTTVWSVPNVQANPFAAPGIAGKIQTSDGKGNLTSLYPFTTSGWSGTDTIGGGGSVTVSTCTRCGASSIIQLTATGAGNLLPPAVTSKGSGTFDVGGTATGTFDWVLLKP